MPELAKRITLQKESRKGLYPTARLFIDGQEFPWHIRAQTVVKIAKTETPTVMVEILCEEFEVRSDHIEGSVR